MVAVGSFATIVNSMVTKTVSAKGIGGLGASASQLTLAPALPENWGLTETSAPKGKEKTNCTLADESGRTTMVVSVLEPAPDLPPLGQRPAPEQQPLGPVIGEILLLRQGDHIGRAFHDLRDEREVEVGVAEVRARWARGVPGAGVLDDAAQLAAKRGLPVAGRVGEA